MARLQVRRLGYALGAEVTGLDLRAPLDDETVSALRKTWLEHIVLCFPEQELTPAELIAFGGRFGELDDNRAVKFYRHSDHPEVIEVQIDRASAPQAGAGDRNRTVWHTDRAYTARPSTATFLNNRDLPEVGGDTMFANLYTAFETLSPALQQMLESLEGVHDIKLGGAIRASEREVEEVRRNNPPIVHPIVKVHPETGRKALYVDNRVRNFVGMTEDESKPLVDFLKQHAVRYENVYRHRWSVHDLLMWDNRCALHFAVPDYEGLRRMQRCSLLGPETGRVYEETLVTV